jgi:hypothetical protein
MNRLLKRGVVTPMLFVLLFPQWALASTIDEWVGQNTKDTEKVLCKREVRNEYFFMAQAGRGIVKLGNRLNMTGYTDTHTYIVSWRFLNDQDQSLSAKVTPTSVRSEYVRSGNMIFAENVEYQTLKTEKPGKVRVTAEVKKCATSQCTRQENRNQKDEEYTLELCEIQINE